MANVQAINVRGTPMYFTNIVTDPHVCLAMSAALAESGESLKSVRTAVNVDNLPLWIAEITLENGTVLAIAPGKKGGIAVDGCGVLRRPDAIYKVMGTILSQIDP